jgi:hypothetical protein
MDRTAIENALLASFWNDAATEGLWAASWPKSLEGLTAQQAAWTPPSAPGATKPRHSIWLIVSHMCFWREDALRRLTDPSKPTDTALAAGNFPVPTDITERAWAATRERFADTQRRIAAELAKPTTDTSRLRYMLVHDCYHFGQINYIRAMLGLPPIE